MELYHPLVQGLVTRNAASVGWVGTKGRLVLSTEASEESRLD